MEEIFKCISQKMLMKFLVIAWCITSCFFLTIKTVLCMIAPCITLKHFSHSHWNFGNTMYLHWNLNWISYSECTFGTRTTQKKQSHLTVVNGTVWFKKWPKMTIFIGVQIKKIVDKTKKITWVVQTTPNRLPYIMFYICDDENFARNLISMKKKKHRKLE